MDDKTIKALIDALDNCSELFFIGKTEDGNSFNFVCSELTHASEWVETIQHFKEYVINKINETNTHQDAINDLLSDFDINKNNDENNN